MREFGMRERGMMAEVGGGWWRGGCGSAEGDDRGGDGDEGRRTKVSKLKLQKISSPHVSTSISIFILSISICILSISIYTP
jgi:hypothetical protein